VSGAAPTASASFDPRALTEPVDRNAARAFARGLRETNGMPRSGVGKPVAVFIIAVVVFVLTVGAVSFIAAIAGALATGDSGSAALFALLPILVMVAVVGVILFRVRHVLGGMNERWYRLDRFARTNGMTFLPRVVAPGLPGMIFGLGDARFAWDVVRGDRPRFVEFGNYSFSTGSGKSRTTHEWGYVAVKLDVPLPHIVLDSTGNNSVFGSNLPVTFDTDQRLGLEGDFDQHFSLYCPEDYERDALYLFTPDIMARFIDNAAVLDVEIVDDWLFLYGRRRFSTLDPATWAWLFSVVGALLDKFAQWARWRDERLVADAPPMTDAAAPASIASAAGAAPASAIAALRPPPGVALPGRRLQRGIPWKSLIVMAAVLAFWLLSQTGFLGVFFR